MDFTLAEKDLLKYLPSKFYEQSPSLMKERRYFVEHGGDVVAKKYDSNDAKIETQNLRMLLKNNKVHLYKLYNDNEVPYYRVNFSAFLFAKWELLINPKTGDIESIQYDLLEE